MNNKTVPSAVVPVRRRAALKGAAWAAPVAVVSVAAPVLAASIPWDAEVSLVAVPGPAYAFGFLEHGYDHLFTGIAVDPTPTAVISSLGPGPIPAGTTFLYRAPSLSSYPPECTIAFSGSGFTVGSSLVEIGGYSYYEITLVSELPVGSSLSIETVPSGRGPAVAILAGDKPIEFRLAGEDAVAANNSAIMAVYLAAWTRRDTDGIPLWDTYNKDGVEDRR
ncbi:hypothetical protein [Brachybacterium hainanense]|uniref:Htaa domain-containing protein n=1 Tax=Brachybacterium hainanense TaxID=1541174 RepID=A0ABV6RBI5_9MICO